MSVKIRLSVIGKTHQVSYRMVAQDSRAKRDGKFLEILGFVNPHDPNNAVKIDKDRIKFYVSRGATFTSSAKYVFENSKLPPRPKKVREAKVESPQSDTQKVEDQKTETANTENQPTEAESSTDTKEQAQESQTKETEPAQAEPSQSPQKEDTGQDTTPTPTTEEKAPQDTNS